VFLHDIPLDNNALAVTAFEKIELHIASGNGKRSHPSL
jgi:hypothetical protein